MEVKSRCNYTKELIALANRLIVRDVCLILLAADVNKEYAEFIRSVIYNQTFPLSHLNITID